MEGPSFSLFTGSLLIAKVVAKLFEKALHLYTKDYFMGVQYIQKGKN